MSCTIYNLQIAFFNCFNSFSGPSNVRSHGISSPPYSSRLNLGWNKCRPVTRHVILLLTLCACAAGLQQSFCVSVCYHSRVDLCSPSVVPTESARYFEDFQLVDFAKTLCSKVIALFTLLSAWPYMKYCSYSTRIRIMTRKR